MKDTQQDVGDLIYSPTQTFKAGMEYLDERRHNKAQLIPLGIPALDKPDEDGNFFLPMAPGELITITARPGCGKTGLMMAVARARAAWLRANGYTNRVVVYATMEQSIEELNAFMVAAQARQKGSSVSITSMASGEITDAEWDDILAAGTRQVQDPLWFIGHSVARRKSRVPITPSNIISACEQIERWHSGTDRDLEIDMVFVDYLQRLKFEGKVESKTIGVSDNLDRLKDGALQLACSMMVGVQARREVDTYALPIPGLDDGQWCLAGDTLLMDAETGVIRPVSEWYMSGKIPVVHALDGNWELKTKLPARLVTSGEQKIYKLTASGNQTIRTSGNHPLLTPEGWVRMDEIKPGDYVAFANKLDVLLPKKLGANRSVFLGMMLGDGTYTDGRTPGYNSGNDPALGEFIGNIAVLEFASNLNYGYNEAGQLHYVYFSGLSGFRGSNQVINWLREIGIYGQKHDDACIPDVVLMSDTDDVKSFLMGLFSADGSFPVPKHPSSPVVSFTTTNRLFAKQVQLLLLRCGIFSGIQTHRPGKRNVQVSYSVYITGNDNVDCYMREIGFVPSQKAERALAIWQTCVSMRAGVIRSSDSLPPSISSMVIERVKKAHLRSRFNMVKGRGISRAKLSEIADAIPDDNGLRTLVNSQVHWLRVSSVEPDGYEQTYDLSVPPYHNFVANGFVVHNTSNIEQASDGNLSLVRAAKYRRDGEFFGSMLVEGHCQMLITNNKRKLGPDNFSKWVYFAPEYNHLDRLEMQKAEFAESDPAPKTRKPQARQGKARIVNQPPEMDDIFGGE